MKAEMPPRHPEFDRAAGLIRAGRVPEAALILNALAARDEPLSLNMLAEMHWGGLLPQDPARARGLFARAAAAGYAPAAHRVTNLLASGIAGPRGWPAALARLHSEAARDTGRAKALAVIERMQLNEGGDPLVLPDARALSETPWVRQFERLFTASECDYIREVAAAGYQPSTVYDSQRRLVRDPIRSSDGSTLHWLIEDPAIHALNRRLAAASGIDAANGEAAQVLRYRPGQQYRPHLDFVRASDNQRVLTALVWLNHDYQGGETAFVKTGLRAKGRKGDALLFRNALPDRGVDPLAEHAGLPVTRGEKYLYSRWIRERRWAP